MVEFWREEDAREAEEALHCLDLQGQNIAVQVYQPRRAGISSTLSTSSSPSGIGGTRTLISEFSPNAPTFVPTGSVCSYPGTPPGSSGGMAYSPPRGSPYGTSPLTRSPVFVHGPGQQVQLAPLSGPGSNSHSGLIDPCNLFIKVSSSWIRSERL